MSALRTYSKHNTKSNRVTGQVIPATAMDSVAVRGRASRSRDPIPLFKGDRSTSETSHYTPPVAQSVLRSPGKPLDRETRSNMESRFGVSLEGVRVHSDINAAESARAVNAKAFTFGDHIAFGAGHYAPATLSGKRLIAHELTHVIQQRRGGTNTIQASEFQARSAAERIVSGQGVPPNAVGGAPLGLYADSLGGSLDTAADSRYKLKLDPALGQFNLATLDGFELNHPEMPDRYNSEIKDIAGTVLRMLSHSPTSKVTITGHTDATGGEEYNMELGKKRALSAAAALSEAGVPFMAINTESAGKSHLKVDTKAPNPQNRRVEIRFDTDMNPPMPVSSPITSFPGVFTPSLPGLGGPGPFNLPYRLGDQTAEDPNKPCPVVPTPRVTFDLNRFRNVPTFKQPSFRDQLEQRVHGDPALSGIRHLNRDVYNAVIDGLAQADEGMVTAAIGQLNTDSKTQASLTAAAVALLKTLKGEKFKPPTPTPYIEPPPHEFSPYTAPGEHIFTTPQFKLDLFPTPKARPKAPSTTGFVDKTEARNWVVMNNYSDIGDLSESEALRVFNLLLQSPIIDPDIDAIQRFWTAWDNRGLQQKLKKAIQDHLPEVDDPDRRKRLETLIAPAAN